MFKIAINLSYLAGDGDRFNSLITNPSKQGRGIIGHSIEETGTKRRARGATAETVAEEERQRAAQLRTRADNKWTSANACRCWRGAAEKADRWRRRPAVAMSWTAAGGTWLVPRRLATRRESRGTSQWDNEGGTSADSDWLGSAGVGAGRTGT
ncbi:hypothetical protein DAPPUDRAFT_250993 [Daphnia pulex]|uniref:Uncharacterized protein n=1 Tax=Daphnia pulex TaxID=6669 RepID=E9GZJ8_DAPPU|nr:hypothetical protein DAPPUDRAFT_250993 [Daphnia pulex]|eukprot:EFX75006.1 hypothetical protein DAPPUDRAFT_250993 [Daphnia pulex]